MNDYYPYHLQSHSLPPPSPHAQSAPQNEAGGYTYPLPYPRRGWRWRDRFSMTIGLALIGLAGLTLFLDRPENYFKADVQPRRVIDSAQWEQLLSMSPSSPRLRPRIPENTPIIDDTPSFLSIPPPPPVPMPKPKPVMKASNYIVQIASERSRAAAKRSYYILHKRHQDVFAGTRPAIERVNLAGLGVFHRLYILPFAQRTEAVRFCRTLKQRGDDCLVKQR